MNFTVVSWIYVLSCNFDIRIDSWSFELEVEYGVKYWKNSLKVGFERESGVLVEFSVLSWSFVVRS